LQMLGHVGCQSAIDNPKSGGRVAPARQTKTLVLEGDEGLQETHPWCHPD
jgi:hypothetical protein